MFRGTFFFLVKVKVTLGQPALQTLPSLELKVKINREREERSQGAGASCAVLREAEGSGQEGRIFGYNVP